MRDRYAQPHSGLTDAFAMFKDTSLVSVIAVVELTKQYQILARSSLKFIEIGLLTPPLGMSAFVVKANLNDPSISTWQIFKGTMPMTITMTLFLVLVVLFPSISLVLLGRGWSWW